MKMAVSIAIHLFFSYFRMTYIDVKEKVKAVLANSYVMDEDQDDAIEFLSAILRLIMTYAKSNNTNLNHFLFEIDEIRKLRDKCFPNRVKGKFNDLEFSWLRNTALVISSSEIGPEGSSDSRRVI